jgi:hypothetical protein
MSDEEDDPFEQFEDISDREGDPFEQLGDATDGDHGETTEDSEWSGDPLGGSDAGKTGTDGSDTTAEASAGAASSEQPSDAHDTTPAGESADTGDGVVEMDEPEIDTGSNDPFGDVGGRAGDPFDDDVFEEMDAGELDPDEVWASIADAKERGSISGQAERTYAEVSKHRFCEQCEFFSDPPDVACTHEGTEILEFLDNETVRLVDCPVVAERKQLEKHD